MTFFQDFEMNKENQSCSVGKPSQHVFLWLCVSNRQLYIVTKNRPIESLLESRTYVELNETMIFISLYKTILIMHSFLYIMPTNDIEFAFVPPQECETDQLSINCYVLKQCRDFGEINPGCFLIIQTGLHFSVT